MRACGGGRGDGCGLARAVARLHEKSIKSPRRASDGACTTKGRERSLSALFDMKCRQGDFSPLFLAGGDFSFFQSKHKIPIISRAKPYTISSEPRRRQSESENVSKTRVSARDPRPCRWHHGCPLPRLTEYKSKSSISVRYAHTERILLWLEATRPWFPKQRKR